VRCLPLSLSSTGGTFPGNVFSGRSPSFPLALPLSIIFLGGGYFPTNEPTGFKPFEKTRIQFLSLQIASPWNFAYFLLAGGLFFSCLNRFLSKNYFSPSSPFKNSSCQALCFPFFEEEGFLLEEIVPFSLSLKNRGWFPSKNVLGKSCPAIPPGLRLFFLLLFPESQPFPPSF